jgi:hypothetical protein
MWKNIAGIVTVQSLLVIILSSVGPTFTAGLFFVGILSGVSAIFYIGIKSIYIRYFFIVAAPFYISYSLYWIPASGHRGNAEYSAWEFIFVIPWFLAGLICSIVAYYITTRQRKTRN